jgi:chemosensory pili system protein ChpE
MPSDVMIVLTGIALGFAYCAVPGAVNTECIRRGLSGGFRPAVLIQGGALLGDMVWATLGLTGAAFILRVNALVILLGLVGAGFLFSLARNSFRSSRAPVPTSTGGLTQRGRPLIIGATFSLANPAGLAFWSGIGGGLLATLGDPSPGEIALLLTAFFVGSMLWCVAISAVVSWGRRFASPRLFRWVDALSGVALSYFAVRLLISTLRRLGAWLLPGVRALV